MTDAGERAAVAEEAARAGGRVAMDAFRSGLGVERKGGKTDVVTQADRDAQDRVVEVIRSSYPDDPIVGEEGDDRPRVPDEGAAWVVDPIDGTNNYARESPFWVTSVAAAIDGEPVAAATVAPALDDVYVAGAGETRRNGDPVAVSDRTDPQTFTVCPTFWWGYDRRDEFSAVLDALVRRFNDQHRIGSAQLALCLLASGAYEGVVTNLRMNPWDSMAGVHLVRQAGGVATDLEGNRWRHDADGIVAATPDSRDDVLAAVRDALGR